MTCPLIGGIWLWVSPHRKCLSVTWPWIISYAVFTQGFFFFFFLAEIQVVLNSRHETKHFLQHTICCIGNSINGSLIYVMHFQHEFWYWSGKLHWKVKSEDGCVTNILNGLKNPSCGWFVCRTIHLSWLFVWLVGWLIASLVDWLVGCLLSRLVACLFGRSFRWLRSWLVFSLIGCLFS